MSSCSRRLLLLGGALALGGCGFRPLYGGGASGGPGTLFESVRVVREPGELGFRLHAALVERLRPAASPAPFVLTTETTLRRSGLAIEPDDQITRFNLRLATRYTLRRAGEGSDAVPLATGDLRVIAAYNATPSQYATLVSERQVLRRAARDMAEKIVKRLAIAHDPAWGG